MRAHHVTATKPKNDLSPEKRRKAIRAQERRYGQSMLPYRFKTLEPGRYRIIDDENDAYTDFGFRKSGRLIAFYDASPHDPEG